MRSCASRNIAQRFEAPREVRHVAAERRRRHLLQRRLQRLHRLRPEVEVLADPGNRCRDVGLEARVVVVHERDARRQQPQAQILAQEILLRRQEQRRRGTIRRFDPHELLHIAPQVDEEPLPGGRIGGRRYRCGGRAVAVRPSRAGASPRPRSPGRASRRARSRQRTARPSAGPCRERARGARRRTAAGRGAGASHPRAAALSARRERCLRAAAAGSPRAAPARSPTARFHRATARGRGRAPRARPAAPAIRRSGSRAASCGPARHGASSRGRFAPWRLPVSRTRRRRAAPQPHCAARVARGGRRATQRPLRPRRSARPRGATILSTATAGRERDGSRASPARTRRAVAGSRSVRTSRAARMRRSILAGGMGTPPGLAAPSLRATMTRQAHGQARHYRRAGLLDRCTPRRPPA